MEWWRARLSLARSKRVHDLRNWTHDLHRTVDDRPFGGGEGMLLKPEPIFDAVETIWPSRTPKQKVILLSAQGRRFTQQMARELLENEELLLICGRYEGVDERVAQHLADDELSIGDYVLSGGELAAAVVMDAVARLLPGVVGNQDSTRQRIVRAGDSRLPAMDPACRIPRLEGAGCPARREPCRDPEMAKASRHGENGPAPARPAAK